mmetsp:Transcript_25916/g.103616  ORF Transcript_25916/g.103616 Transcript_25916/m.103616 type:complete len:435 (+) Transcript_25916:1536-2840(+)
MPWNAHLVDVFEAHGFDSATGRFRASPPPRPVAALYQAARHAGCGACRMPFPKPRIEEGVLARNALVRSSGRDHRFDVVAERTGRAAYALVSTLRGCNYGSVCYGVRVVAHVVREGTAVTESAASSSEPYYEATSEEVAVKRIERATYAAHVRKRNGELNEDPVKEIAAMQAVAGASDAVLPLLDCFADDERLYVVVPFCGKGDLFSLVERHGKLPDRLARLYFQQIVRGVGALHAHGVAHHDLSLENVLRVTDRAAVVIDFGMAVKVAGPTATKFLPRRRRGAGARGAAAAAADLAAPEAAATPDYFAVPTRPGGGWPCKCGKRDYMAPELLNPARAFDLFAADVWALGVILYILLVGFPPWDSKTAAPDNVALDHDECYAYIKAGQLQALLAGWNIHLRPSAIDLLSRLLDYEPTTRITLPQVMRHPWWHER